ncbi:hypothetical protein [Streptomyces sp. GbtcB7]|uniref:hypothetical protein n=1 Tax=Streptomyces sp. GbtcB7 TaxID=2824752 RepID=UPI001C2FE5C7|nr:hypothetical protein [Streptomyces sp. GbtcB7]
MDVFAKLSTSSIGSVPGTGVADKTRWGLTIDPTEHAALSEALSNCPDQPITVTLAR